MGVAGSGAGCPEVVGGTREGGRGGSAQAMTTVCTWPVVANGSSRVPSSSARRPRSSSLGEKGRGDAVIKP